LFGKRTTHKTYRQRKEQLAMKKLATYGIQDRNVDTARGNTRHKGHRSAYLTLKVAEKMTRKFWRHLRTFCTL